MLQSLLKHIRLNILSKIKFEGELIRKHGTLVDSKNGV